MMGLPAGACHELHVLHAAPHVPQLTAGPLLHQVLHIGRRAPESVRMPVRYRCATGAVRKSKAGFKIPG